MIVCLYSTLYHTFCKVHVNIAVIDHRIGKQRVDYSLKVAHAAVGCFCDIS